MPVVIVVGGQWGDEGKGKVVDYLTQKANLVVRFQGGNNAGHTVVIEGEKTALKLFPSGILRPHTRCLIGAGVVVNLEAFMAEYEMLQSSGIEVSPKRLGIAGEVNLILPYHCAIDAERERLRGGEKIGTTGRGIGPAYEDLVSRCGVRFGDLFNPKQLQSVVRQNVELKNKYLKSVLESSTQFDADEILDFLKMAADKLGPHLANVSLEISEAAARNDYVLFEGAQGTFLDIIHGTYPYVTSSNTIAGAACVSTGLNPRSITRILGIFKAYCTRVGGGPFPSEDEGNDGTAMRDAGGEYGTVTGRPRRCGWFDVLAARKAIRLNGIDSLMITKLDVLDAFEKIKICTGYELDGKPVNDMPVCAVDVERLVPQYEEFDGWKQDTTSVRSFSDLPPRAKQYLERLEELVGCEVYGFSVGPDRKQTVIAADVIWDIGGKPCECC